MIHKQLKQVGAKIDAQIIHEVVHHFVYSSHDLGIEYDGV